MTREYVDDDKMLAYVLGDDGTLRIYQYSEQVVLGSNEASRLLEFLSTGMREKGYHPEVQT